MSKCSRCGAGLTAPGTPAHVWGSWKWNRGVLCPKCLRDCAVGSSLLWKVTGKDLRAIRRMPEAEYSAWLASLHEKDRESWLGRK